MNYDHAFHAGNFADVMKHTVLMACIEQLKKKPAPFRVIDTHAGAGRYRLGDGSSARTGEWQGGIGRLLGGEASPLPAAAAAGAILACYLDAIRRENPGGRLETYPGSPALVQAALRPGDRLVANEYAPAAAAALRLALGRDKAVRVTMGDGYAMLKASLPPPERRGLVLVDPPFEAPGEFMAMSAALREGLKRFATGVYLLWYPIKDPKPVARFHRAVAQATHDANVPLPLVVELLVRPARNPHLLNGAGMVVVNPPYRLEEQLGVAFAALADRLGDGGKGSARVERFG